MANSFIEMVREVGLKKDSWINNELKSFLRVRQFDSTNVLLEHIPRHLNQLTVTCTQGHSFTPSWLSKHPPYLPFEPRSGGIMSPTAGEILCPTCNDRVSLPFPRKVIKGDVHVYGDEAFREVKDRKLWLYGFVNFTGDSANLKQLKADFYQIKSKFNKNDKPGNWVLHLKEAFDGNSRKKVGGIYNRDSEEIYSMVHDVTCLIGSYNKKLLLNTYVGYSITPQKKFSKEQIKRLKRIAFGSTAFRIIDDATENGLCPHFYFEKTGDDGWAKNYFHGARLTLLWPFLSHCLPVKSPEFVAPTFDFRLELADVICFTLARAFHDQELGKRALINPANLSLIRYTESNEHGWLSSSLEYPPFLEQ